MSFQPNPGDELFINGAAYIVGQHPVAPGIAYAQAGRQGIVYQLMPVDGAIHEAKALKVFFPKFRIPAMVYQTDSMESFSTNPGLRVCHRDVLTPEKNGELIAAHPDLLYAVFMPWIYGSTWFDIITEQRVLQRKESLTLSKALAAIGSGMEQRGLSHCDLSAPNVMLPYFSDVELPDGGSPVELVDVEQMYSPKLDRPDVLLAGSAGYAAHRTVTSGLWSAYADRFAGAIILSEMLGWCDANIVNEAWGESYFDQHEMQNPCARYVLLKQSLEQNWGTNLAELFSRAWDSQDLSSCPTFGEWLVALSTAPEELPVDEGPIIPWVDMDIESSGFVGDEVVVRKLFDQARVMEKKGHLSGALEVYRSAYHFVDMNSPMQVELAAAIRGLEQQLNPSTDGESPVKGPFWRSRKFLISIVTVLIVLVGLGLTVNHLVAVQNEEGQKKAAQLESEKQTAEATKLEEARKQEEALKKETEEQTKAEDEKKAIEAKESEALHKEKDALKRKELQDKYDKQVKYDAYLSQRKLAKQKAEELKKFQAKVAQEKQEQQEREAKRLAAAQAEKEQTARTQQLKKSRAQNVVKLIASYNQAYNARSAGNKVKAREYALEFVNRYEKDASYYKTVGNVSKRASSIYKLLSNQNYKLPNI